MDIEKYRSALLDKERQLVDEISRARADGRDAKVAEVEDPIDSVISSEAQSAAFEETSRLSGTLEAVRAALQRIDDGSYGTCVDCGKSISEPRLDAVPWTPYCLEDQEKRDSRGAQQPDESTQHELG